MKSIFSIKTSAIIFLIFIGATLAVSYSSNATESPIEEKLEAWADNHPRAAAELETWVDTHTDAARALFKWDNKHPEQSKAFIIWVVTHQGKKMDIFIEEHPEWRRFNKIVTMHRAAISDFTVWCRFHPKASAALMQHPKALHWVGQHLFKGSLMTKDD